MLNIILWRDSISKIMHLRCTVWTESQKMCRFRGLTESKSDDKNVRQSAIFYQILLKFELNQGLCNIYSMTTFKINVPKFEGDRVRTI